ncbi:putative ribonuclease H-like domain-containing protein, partial [Tanacetum coccineum]
MLKKVEASRDLVTGFMRVVVDSGQDSVEDVAQLHMKYLLKVLLKPMMYKIQKMLADKDENIRMRKQAFEENKSENCASQKRKVRLHSNNKLSTDRQFVITDRHLFSTDRPSVSTDRSSVSTDRPSISTDRPFVSTDRSSANTSYVSAPSTPIGANASESSFVYLGGKISIDASTLPNADLPIDLNMLTWKMPSVTIQTDGIFNGAYDDDDEDVGAVADFNNMDNTIAVSPIPTLRIHKDHPKGQILGDPTSAVQTRGKIQKASSAQQALVSTSKNRNRTNHKDHQNYLFACFLSQEEPKTISQALQDESWVEAMQEELLQFKLQKVWVLVDLPYGKKVIGTKWVFRNKRDERSIVVKNKARLVAQGFRQEEGIDYDEPPGFVDPAHPNKVYKVIKALYGLHQALRAWYETLSSFLMENGFRRDVYVYSCLKIVCTIDSRDETHFLFGLQVKQQADANTPIESNKSLVKDEDGIDVRLFNVLQVLMIGSLMYLTASRPDIMFAVCACARFQVTPKASHLNAVKRIFRSTRSLSYGKFYYLTGRIRCSANCCGQFWTTAKSRTVNNTSYIDATVAGKPLTISEASIRSDLLFDDADGIDSLNNEAIFDNIQLMG